MKPEFLDAVLELAPNVSYTYHPETLEIETWDDPTVQDPDGLGIAQPTKAEIETKLATIISDWDALAWKRSRQAEYPTIDELVVALYDTDDKSAVEAKRAAVKLKYPKPE